MNQTFICLVDGLSLLLSASPKKKSGAVNEGLSRQVFKTRNYALLEKSLQDFHFSQNRRTHSILIAFLHFVQLLW